MTQDSTQLIMQVAAASHLPVTGKAIADQFKKLFPAYLEKLPIEVFEPLKPGDAIRIVLGANAETGIDILAIPEPIPPAMLTFAYATNPHWPEARAELQRSRAHIVAIGLQRKDGKDDPIRTAICLTLVTACLCNLVPAIGVFCPSGNALTPVRRLRELAAGMLTGEPPVEAWVQTMLTDAPAEGGKRRLFAMSNGLRALVGREIEIQPTARDRESLAQAVHLLLRFTMQRGAPFGEGDSVKLKGGDAACVRFADQGQRPDIPIFETRIVKLDEQGKLPPDAFGDRPLAPKAPPRDRAAEFAAGPAEPVRPEEKIFVANILLARHTPVSSEILAAAIRRRFSKFEGEYASIGDEGPGKASRNSQMFLVRGTPIAIMAIDVPIPPANFTNAISAAEIVWPDAAKTIAQHQAHLVIGNITSANGFSDATRRAGDLTILVAALCDIVPALAVHWGAGDTIIKPADFQNGANQYLAGTPPVDTWLQLRLIRATTEDGRPGLAMVTNGLVPFLDREIEFLPAAVHPVIVGQRVIGTAQYLLQNGPVVEHGHTMGISHSEAVRVRHLERGRYTRRPVYELTLEVLDPSISPTEPGHLKEVPAVPPPEQESPEPEQRFASVQTLRPPAVETAIKQAEVPEPESPPEPPKTAPDKAASRLVRNLRRPQS